MSTICKIICVMLLAPALVLAQESNVYIFALDAARMGGWSSDGAVCEGVIPAPPATRSDPELKVVRNREKARDELWLTAQFPSAAGLVKRVREDRAMWARGSAFRADIYAPAEAGSYVSAQMIACHRVWGWFATEPTRALTSGAWNSVLWDLDAVSDEWRSLSGSTAWNDSLRQNLTFVGMRFFGQGVAASASQVPSGVRDLPTNVPSGVRDLPLSTATLRIANMAIEGLQPSDLELRTVGVRFPKAPVKRGQCFEITFDLTRAYGNPFDPDDVAVDVDFFGYSTDMGVGVSSGSGGSGGSGGSIGAVEPQTMANTGGLAAAVSSATLPAFWFQDYTRRRLEDNTEACDSRGKACWKARFTPRVAGPHFFRIRAQDHAGARYESPLYAFKVEDAPFRGFVRVDPKDPRYLSFDGDNSLFYPIGMVIRSPWDARCGYHYEFEPQPDLETYAYDDFFKRMNESGMNVTRVWMAAWWLALEWSRGYREDFEGLGRYSLFNAWRMDHVIRLGEKYGIYFDITLNNHGQFGVSSELDREWQDNPHYRANGGPLRSSVKLWTDPECREYARKRMRYIIGRWGYSTSIAWFLICNEVNLVHAYNSNNIRSYHEFMTSETKAMDPYKHLCSNHVCFGTFDPNVGGQPWLDLKQSNGYHTDMIASVNYLWKQLGAYNLPAYINEFGLGWDSPDYMLYNLHGGLWGSSMAPFCGPALYWFCLYIHYGEKYDQYVALAAFHRGEDYRGMALAPSQGITIENGDKRLEVIAHQNDERAYLWLYDKSLFRRGVGVNPTIKPFAEASFAIKGLKAGRYRVEFWDTWKGCEIAGARQEMNLATGASLTVKAPAFSRDVACKIKRSGEY